MVLPSRAVRAPAQSALGEDRQSIVSAIVGKGLRLTLIGSVLGVTAAAWAPACRAATITPILALREL